MVLLLILLMIVGFDWFVWEVRFVVGLVLLIFVVWLFALRLCVV